MPTNEERREVARKLREPFDVVGQGRYVALNGTLFGMQLLANDEQTLRNGVKHIADFIEPEPTVDRDALLGIAEQMEWASEASYEEVGVVSGGIVGAWAEKIKEACGEVDNHEV